LRPGSSGNGPARRCASASSARADFDPPPTARGIVVPERILATAVRAPRYAAFRRPPLKRSMMRFTAHASLAAIACTLAFTAPAVAQQPTPAPVAARTEVTTQLPRNVRPVRYGLEINPDAANMRFEGRAEIDVQV